MKILFRIALVILLLVTLALGGLVYKIDSVAATAIEEGGTVAMGVKTHVGSANIGIIKSFGKVGIEGLTIDNPKGYAEKEFFSLRNAGFQIDPDSFSTDTLVVPEIVIEGVTLAIERTKDGTNYGKILKNLKRFESADGGTDPSAGEGSTETGTEKKFVVRRIKMNDVKANVKLEALGQQQAFTVKVPDFMIENVGTSDDSQSVSDILSLVLKEVLDEVAKSGGDLLPADMIADIQGQLGDLRGTADSVVEDARAGLQGVLDGTVDTKDLKENAKETVDKAKQGLKGLLKKDQ